MVFLKKIAVKTVFALFCAVIAVGFCVSASYAAESKKLIHIVYDDTSGIYYGDNGEFTDKWSRMKNALSVFCSLTNTGDKIAVYPISGEGEKYEFINNSNASSMADQIDEKLNGYAIHRSFTVVEKAFSDLKRENNSYEKWLVVMCDGKFEEYKNENSDSSVQEKLSSYAEDGVRVVSQSVSNNGAIYNLKNDDNLYCYNANDSKEILQKTIEISNLIYQRAILGDDYIDYNKKNSTLEISDTGIPMSELIVISGGQKSFSSASFSSPVKQTQISVKNPKKFPEVFNKNKNKIKYASDLEKSILINRFENTLQPGKVSVNVSRGDSVTVIYKASIKVELQLYSNESRVDSNASISTGKYTYKATALNPVTGEQIKSDLLDGAVYEILSENQGNVTKLDKKEGEISFLKGNTKIETVIEFASVRFSSSKVFYVFGDTDFTIGKQMRYSVKNLYGAKPFVINVKTESAMDNVTLVCTSDKNISFRCEKGTADGEFYVYPEYKNSGSYLFAPTGNVDLTVTVKINENGELMTFSKPAVIYIENVPFYTRCIDWIWHAKWYLLVLIASVGAFLVSFNFYVKKKENSEKKNCEEQTEQNVNE